MKTPVVFVLLACFGMANPVTRAAGWTARAEQASPEEVVVTATRRPTAREKLPTSVSIIRREDIETLQVASLPQLLSGVAGVDVTTNGGYGKVTGVRVRGSETDHVLVLLDGVRIESATAGIAAFQYIPVSQIERIEIVRGPHSSIWGSEALGGVIHIFTRRGKGDTPLYVLDAGAGSYDTATVSAGISGAEESMNYSAAVSYFDSAGIDARQPTPGRFGVDQPDKDGYDNLSVHLRGGYAFGDGGELDAFMLHAEGDTEFDGSFTDKSEFVQQVVGGNLRLRPLDNWAMQLRLSQSQDKSDDFAADGAFRSRFNTQRRQLSWRHDVQLVAQHDVSFGVDYRNDEIDSNTAYTATSRDNLGLYGQYSGNYQGHQLIASVRRDDDQAFGSKITGSVGWRYRWQGGLRLYASYGTAYKTPTFNELFFPGCSNPGLQPETAASWEAGLAGGRQDGMIAWAVSAYRTTFEDLIVTTFNPVDFSCLLNNVGTASVSGIEAVLEANWQGWQVHLAAEYLEPEDEETGRRLPRRVKQQLTLDLKREFGALSLAGRVLAEGNRFDDTANSIRVGGFVTLDVLAEYRVNHRLSFSAKVANLLDKDYHTVATYNSFGRNFFVGLRYRSR